MRTPAKRFVVCLKNKGYEVSLEPRKIYQALPDLDAARHRQLRVIDESGEDYLSPASYFTPIELPQLVRKSVTRLRERQRPDITQSDLPQRAIASAVPVEEDLSSRSRAAHAQTGTLRVTALLTDRHLGDNSSSQELRFSRYRFFDIYPH